MKEEVMKVKGAFPLTRRDWALILAVALIALAARAIPGPRTIDDAYITFRYARNLVEGAGFVYNPGERVLGTTTPLFALAMALIAFVTGRSDYPTLALVVSALADTATCTLLYLLARRLLGSRVPATALALLWAITPMSVTFAIGGMETSVFILWMTATLWLYINGREQWMALTAALGALTRPDAAMWAGLIFLHQLWARVRARNHHPVRDWLPWRTWLIFALALLPWVLFALAYFGSPIPRSVGAKAMVYTIAPAADLIRLMQHFATPFSEYTTLRALGTGMGLFLYPTLFAAGALALARRDGRVLPILVYPLLYAAVFVATNILIFRWYLAPPLPAYFLGIVAGAWTLLNAVSEAIARRRGDQPVGARHASPLPQMDVFGVIAALWAAFSLNAWTLHPDHGPDRPAPEMAFIGQELLYEQVGRALANHYGATAETLVATGDIGAIGYFSRATIFDTVGLVTPAASAYYPVDRTILVEGNNYAIPPGAVLHAEPDFVVFLEAAGRLGLMQDPAFQAEYELVETIDTTLYQSRGLLVFKRSP